MKISSLLWIIVFLTAVSAMGCSSQTIAVDTFPSSVQINDMDIEFSGYEVDDHKLTMNICFSPPSEETWYFGDVELRINNKEISQKDAIESIRTETETWRADGYDCGIFVYDFLWSKPPAGKAELSIGKIKTLVDIHEQDCARAQKNLSDAKTGIVITCDPTIAGAFTLSKKPALMSDEEAMLIAIEALSYSKAIPLGWKFSFIIEKP